MMGLTVRVRPPTLIFTTAIPVAPWLSVAASVTSYEPGLTKVCETLDPFSFLLPSPNVHLNVIGSPFGSILEEPSKLTENGAWPLILETTIFDCGEELLTAKATIIRF
jgi:hypothetical protein